MILEFIQWIIVVATVGAAVFFLWRILRSGSSACSGCALKDACKRKGQKGGKDKNCPPQ